jgi:mannose-6-phosphate isomerase-like protein (cupin superfamily)
VTILPGGCRVFSPDEGESGSAGDWHWRTPICKATGADRIAQSVSECRGRSPAVVNPRAEEAIYVAEGVGTCQIDGRPYPVCPGVAVYVPPGASYSIESSGKVLRLVHACCPEDPARHFMDHRPSAGSGEAPRRTVREEDRELIPAGVNRLFRYLVHTDLGCRQITQFVRFIPTSKAIPHTHTYEEGIFILSGRGIVHVESEACAFGPGWSIYFPVGVRHCVENPEAAPIRLLGVFYPSGSPDAAYED